MPGSPKHAPDDSPYPVAHASQLLLAATAEHELQAPAGVSAAAPQQLLDWHDPDPHSPSAAHVVPGSAKHLPLLSA